MYQTLTDQNAGSSHNINTDNSFFGKLEEFKCLGTTLTNQNYIQEEIKSILKSVNNYYHAAQNLFSSSLLSKNIQIKHLKNYHFACCVAWVFENRVLRRLFEPIRDKVTREWREHTMRSLNVCTRHPVLFV
jgi:hypothetical protein